MKTKIVYDAHPSVKMMQNWIATLPEKTGRSLDQWVRFGKKEGPKDEKALREWLRKEHGLGTNSDWFADQILGKDSAAGSPEAYLAAAGRYVDGMFKGPKEGLRPIWEELYGVARSLGKDVKVCPCQTIVPFYRKHVFAQVKPATKTRIDMGFALGDMKAKGRLLETGGFAKKDRITHRVEITKIEDVDDAVRKWFRMAYERDV